MALFGLINLAKPQGITSRRALDIVARLVRPSKAGHAGTLDPLAAGVLVVCVGQATRLIEHVQQLPKRYDATFLLGRTSPTEDIEGDVSLLPSAPVPTLDEIEAAAAKFVGTIEQRPPIFSALKVSGQRAHELARAGKEVELRPRPVTIYSLRVAAYAYPKLEVEVECGSGTYIRSLGRDLAESLGTGAVMSALVRTAIGSCTTENAVRPERLTADNIASYLLEPAAVLTHLPRRVLTAAELAELSFGRPILEAAAPASELLGVDADGRLRALLVVKAAGWLHPAHNFAAR